MSHEQHYRSRVRFNSRSNRLVYDAKWLKWPLPLASAMAYRLSVTLLEREAARLVGGSGFSLAVDRAIRTALPQLATPAHVASMLNLSERSLRRKLAQEDLNFRTLLDETRRARALDLVTNGRRSMAQAAAETGFSDGRSFRRAFRRWTGSAPSALRAAQSTIDPGREAEDV
jgi:AraC-like DNA-binding protein